MTAALSTLVRKQQAFRTFEDFGATGGTDDTAAIAAAVAAGGRIVGKAGRTYITSATITPAAGTILDLHGATIKVKDSTAPFDLIAATNSTAAAPIKIIGGTLNGNRDNSTWTGFADDANVALVNANTGIGVVVRDCYLTSGWRGVFCYTGTHISVVNNTLNGFEYGIYLLGDLSYSSGTRLDHSAIIEGNRLLNIGHHAIFIGNSKNNRVSNNNIQGQFVSTHRIDVYPDETSGLLKLRPVSAGVWSDFSDVLHQTYFVVQQPWSQTESAEITTTKKASSSLIYATSLAQGGSRGTFTVTSIGTNDVVNTSAAHGLLVNDQVMFTSLAGGGAGITPHTDPDSATTYYVKTTPTTTSFTIATDSTLATTVNVTSAYTTGFGGIKLMDVAASSGTGDLLSIAESDDCTVTGNVLTGGVDQGIVSFGTSRNTVITGNTCKGQGGAGISIASYPSGTSPYAPQNFTLTGNSIVNSNRTQPSVKGSLRWAVRLIGACTGVVEGNTVSDDGVDVEAWITASNTGSDKRIALATSSRADDIIDTVADHGLQLGDEIFFSDLTGGNLSYSTTVPIPRYYVVSTSLGARTFRIASTRGGSAIDWGGAADITAGYAIRLGIGQADYWAGTDNSSARLSIGMNRVYGQINQGIAGGTAPTGRVTFSGIISPSALTADTNNWTPTGIEGAHAINVTQTGGPWKLTGLAAQPPGTRILIWNDSVGTLTLRHQNAGSISANRFYTPTGADYVMAIVAVVEVYYMFGAWFVIGPVV